MWSQARSKRDGGMPHHDHLQRLVHPWPGNRTGEPTGRLTVLPHVARCALSTPGGQMRTCGHQREGTGVGMQAHGNTPGCVRRCRPITQQPGPCAARARGTVVNQSRSYSTQVQREPACS